MRSPSWLVAVQARLDAASAEIAGGEKRHDYWVVGNVEFLKESERAKPARKKREPSQPNPFAGVSRWLSGEPGYVPA